MKIASTYRICYLLIFFSLVTCRSDNPAPSDEIVSQLDLKQGNLISCSPSSEKFGSLVFETSCGKTARDDFQLGVKLLHSFEYDEAEKAFARIIRKQPACAMAYWGVAMSNFHPLWAPPAEAELRKGSRAVLIAQSIRSASEKEKDYIAAIAAFYGGWENTEHKVRTARFEKAMESLHKKYPNDREVAIFYALALNAAADPADKSFVKQRKAAEVLNGLYPDQPDHPGIVHYIIHTYDYPEMAALALPAARKYASVAPSSAHALHMPSHIFTRLGLWEECVSSNLASVASAKCYAESAGINGHWDEELHGMDYLVYGYLQRGRNDLAEKQWEYLKTIKEVYPLNIKVAYAFAAIPSRIALENKDWKKAAVTTGHTADFPWQKHPWPAGIIHFTRLLGAVHTGNIDSAGAELANLRNIQKLLEEQKDSYKAGQVAIQARCGEAWIEMKKGNRNAALELMKAAAAMEDKTEKHPVTPGEVAPARELLADMYLEMNRPLDALEAYEDGLKKRPNRFNGLYGAAVAAEQSGNEEKADQYYRQLINVADPAGPGRPELTKARKYLEGRQQLVYAGRRQEEP